MIKTFNPCFSISRPDPQDPLIYMMQNFELDCLETHEIIIALPIRGDEVLAVHSTSGKQETDLCYQNDLDFSGIASLLQT